MIHIDVRSAEKCNNATALFLSFPYDTKIVEVVRSLPTRYWNSEKKEWEVPFSKLPFLMNALKQYEILLEGDIQDIEPKKEPVKIPDGFAFKTQPFSHQIDGFEFGLSNQRWLLGDEQGLGKTKQVIDIAVAKKMQSGYKHCLIICGVNGLKWNWQNEIAVHSNESGWILGQRLNSKGKLKIGSTKDKLHDLTHLNDISSHFLITNVESLRDADIVAQIVKLCKNKTIGMIAFDECHKAKNPTSQQGKGILKVSAENMIAMTGTPLMNNPMDLFIILKWLGYEKHSFTAFKQHYCVMGGYGGYEIIGYKNLDELQEQFTSVMLRRLKEDVLDLPEKIFIDEYVEMTGKQEQIYKEVTAEIRMNIDQIKKATNPLTQLIRMRQATGFTGILSSTIRESAKLDRMVELIDESIANGKKVVVFSNWTQMTHAIEERLAKENLGRYATVITGETTDNERQFRVNQFQTDTNTKIIIGTIGAMGTGLTLTAGTVEIFMDEPWTMAAKEQAIDRCHRIGATSNITIYTLLAKNTIDERIHELVLKKGAMASAIVDGKITGDRGELVDFLLG